MAPLVFPPSSLSLSLSLSLHGRHGHLRGGIPLVAVLGERERNDGVVVLRTMLERGRANRCVG